MGEAWAAKLLWGRGCFSIRSASSPTCKPQAGFTENVYYNKMSKPCDCKITTELMGLLAVGGQVLIGLSTKLLPGFDLQADPNRGGQMTVRKSPRGHVELRLSVSLLLLQCLPAEVWQGRGSWLVCG